MGDQLPAEEVIMAKKRRRASRGLGGIARTNDDLKRQAKACGSHYFEPGTMRFFNSRLLAVYPVAGKDVTYFVERKGGDRGFGRGAIPKHYTIGVFKQCRVSSIGKGIGRGSASGIYHTSEKAKKIARAIQSKAEGYGTTLKLKRKRKR